MRRCALLWIDLTLRSDSADAIALFEEYFSVRRAPGRTTALDAAATAPDALCFDFDFPDRPALEMLRQTRKDHPSTPVLMLTVHHSEELAVWALRTRVLDYLVKPLNSADVKRCHEAVLGTMSGDRRADVRETAPLPPEAPRPADRRMSRLAVAVEYVKAHLGDTISERKMAALCGMSVYSFSRSFHAAHQQTFQAFVTDLRIERAQQLLKNPALRIAEVASVVGFNDPSYFGKVFRRYHSMTPTQWQQAWSQQQSGEARLQLYYPDTPDAGPRRSGYGS